MLSAINDLMLDLLATVARKDYQDRRRRQKEGITKSLSSGLCKGRKDDTELSKKIEMLLHDGKPYSVIIHLLGCSRDKIARASKRLKQENPEFFKSWRFMQL